MRIKIHDRRERSKPGQRHQIMLNERRYQAHVEALQRRKEAQKARAHKDPKWKVRKGNRRTGGGGQ